MEMDISVSPPDFVHIFWCMFACSGGPGGLSDWFACIVGNPPGLP